MESEKETGREMRKMMEMVKEIEIGREMKKLKEDPPTLNSRCTLPLSKLGNVF